MAALSFLYAATCFQKRPPSLISSIQAENDVFEHRLDWKRAFSACFHENERFDAQNWVYKFGHRLYPHIDKLLDPDPHRNHYGSKTLLQTRTGFSPISSKYRCSHKNVFAKKTQCYLHSISVLQLKYSTYSFKNFSQWPDHGPYKIN